MQTFHLPGVLRPSDQPIFVGAVASASVDALASPLPPDAKVGFVRFDPRAHTRWHTHDCDQILFVVAGAGHVGTRERDYLVTPGDVVRIPAGEEHYHGGGADQEMAHYAFLSAGARTEIGDDVAVWPPTGTTSEAAL